MISLLLTLFISVFSFCSSINRLEDHNENTIIVNDNLTKCSYRDNGVTTMTYSEMATPEFYYTIIDTMRHSEIDPDFVGLGGTITLTQPYGVFNSSYDSVNNRLVNEGDIYSIVLSYDKSLDDLWILAITISHNNLGYESYLRYYLHYPDSNMPFMDCYIIYSSYVSNVTRMNRYFSWTFDSELINYFEIPSSYENGYNQGYYEGYNNGKIVGYNNGKADGISSGYQTGYTDGYNEGFQIDPTAATIFNGVLEIGLLPVNFFLSIFNFEVFGINIKSIVSGLLTVAVIIIITRFLFGGKDNDK